MQSQQQVKHEQSSVQAPSEQSEEASSGWNSWAIGLWEDGKEAVSAGTSYLSAAAEDLGEGTYGWASEDVSKVAVSSDEASWGWGSKDSSGSNTETVSVGKDKVSYGHAETIKDGDRSYSEKKSYGLVNGDDGFGVARGNKTTVADEEARTSRSVETNYGITTESVSAGGKLSDTKDGVNKWVSANGKATLTTSTDPNGKEFLHAGVQAGFAIGGGLEGERDGDESSFGFSAHAEGAANITKRLPDDQIEAVHDALRGPAEMLPKGIAILDSVWDMVFGGAQSAKTLEDGEAQVWTGSAGLGVDMAAKNSIGVSGGFQASAELGRTLSIKGTKCPQTGQPATSIALDFSGKQGAEVSAGLEYLHANVGLSASYHEASSSGAAFILIQDAPDYDSVYGKVLGCANAAALEALVNSGTVDEHVSHARRVHREKTAAGFSAELGGVDLATAKRSSTVSSDTTVGANGEIIESKHTGENSFTGGGLGVSRTDKQSVEAVVTQDGMTVDFMESSESDNIFTTAYETGAGMVDAGVGLLEAGKDEVSSWLWGGDDAMDVQEVHKAAMAKHSLNAAEVDLLCARAATPWWEGCCIEAKPAKMDIWAEFGHELCNPSIDTTLAKQDPVLARQIAVAESIACYVAKDSAVSESIHRALKEFAEVSSDSSFEDLGVEESFVDGTLQDRFRKLDTAYTTSVSSTDELVRQAAIHDITAFRSELAPEAFHSNRSYLDVLRRCDEWLENLEDHCEDTSADLGLARAENRAERAACVGQHDTDALHRLIGASVSRDEQAQAIDTFASTFEAWMRALEDLRSHYRTAGTPEDHWRIAPKGTARELDPNKTQIVEADRAFQMGGRQVRQLNHLS